MFRLLPFFLILLVSAPAAADSVWQDGEATGDLVGAFDGNLKGHFVSASQSSSGLTVQIPGAVIELEKALGTPTIDGPIADFADLQLHDNAYGWIHLQGAARIRVDDVREVPRGLAGDGWFLAATDLAWSHADGWLNINATDALISNDGGFQNFGPEPSAWVLLQGGTGVVMDWFAFGDAPFSTSRVADDIEMQFVGTIGDGAPDTLVRLEESGYFAARADRFVFRFGSVAATTVPADDLLLARGGLSFHAVHAGHSIVNLRLPSGVSGQVQWSQDLEPPSLHDITFQNTDPYAPLQAPPTMVSTWDEPVWATLSIGSYEKVATQAAAEVRFRLTGLAAGTTHDYALVARDLAGNTVYRNGTFATGAPAGPAGAINITNLERSGGNVRVHFDALYDDGTPIPLGMVHVFIDKAIADRYLRHDGPSFVVDVPGDARELRIEATTPRGRVSEVLDVSAPAQGAPLAWWLPLAALALARRR